MTEEVKVKTEEKIKDEIGDRLFELTLRLLVIGIGLSFSGSTIVLTELEWEEVGGWFGLVGSGLTLVSLFSMLLGVGLLSVSTLSEWGVVKRKLVSSMVSMFLMLVLVGVVFSIDLDIVLRVGFSVALLSSFFVFVYYVNDLCEFMKRKEGDDSHG